ncbi:hypothetical protein [Acidicapsa ligni]|uniref:hypothetical protein n=1 Tax=Acidicapsa ligni TaxID=542300 RepID=UPI0021E016B4|nr:hypothetical protein [Acidicapsa ligni]
MSLKTLRIHFLYCVTILALAVVIMASARWTEFGSFTQYLRNMATVVSLLLALLAILYSHIVNNGLSKSLKNIREASSAMRKSKEAMKEFSKLTHKISKDTEEYSEKFTNMATDLENYTKS